MKTNLVARPWIMPALSFFWIVLVSLGLVRFWQYARTPGQPASAPQRWPENSDLSRDSRRDSLVMVIHPQCPCSHASLAELAQLMTRASGRLHATVVFVHYPGVSARWIQSSTWQQASAIPGVRVIMDENGALAQRFDAQTSGQTYLYSPQGQLLFSGGLTAERGQEGDSAGLRAAFALLRGQTPTQTRTFVYGCPLFSEPRTPRDKSLCRS